MSSVVDKYFFSFSAFESYATQGAIDQGLSFSVDSIHFLVSLLTTNIPLLSVSIATAPGYSLQISSY